MAKKKAAEAKKYTVTYPSGVNVRTGAGLDNDILRVAKCGEVVEVIETKKVGEKSWGKLAEGWLMLTGLTEEAK